MEDKCMKTNEIHIGHTYSNGKGRARKVVDMGAQYKLYDGQSETNNLLYEIVNDGSKSNRTAGQTHVMTVPAFASWSKADIT